ncbi:MAG: acylphosphatase [Pirellulales bacterium]
MRKVKVIYSGRVQGVGFRMTTQQIAFRFEVSGTVCNVSDGTVELVAVGAQQELSQFLAAIDERFSRNIENALIDWSDGRLGEFIGFSVLPDKWGG